MKKSRSPLSPAQFSMRRARLNWHDRTIVTLLFVVVFLAAALIGAPRNHDRKSGLQGRSGYYRTMLIPGRRTIAEIEESTNIDLDAAKENERVLEEEADVEDDLHEFNAETPETAYEVPISRENNSTSCAVILLKKHPEMCEVVYEIFEFHSLFPRLRQVVTKRMGGRRFNFVYLMMRGKNAMEQLYEAVRCFANCIKKFGRFLGYVEEIIGTTTSAPVRLTPIIDLYPEQETNRSHSWWKNIKNQLNDQVDPALVTANFNPTRIDDEEELSKVKRVDNGRYARRESPKNCAATIMNVDQDVCGTLAKIELLDSILKNSGDEDLFQDSEVLIELDSDNLELGSFLEAVRKSLFNTNNTRLDVDAMEEAWRDIDTRDKSNSHGRRHMVNENDVEVAETFQTPDFKIEFLPQNDYRSFRNTLSGLWNANNFMDERNGESEARRIPTVDYRSSINDENAKQREQSITRRPAATSRRAHGGLPMKNVLTDRNRATSWSTHSARRLGNNAISRNTDKEQQETHKRFEHRRRSWRGPYYPVDTITPIKMYPHYRVGDPATKESNEPTNKNKDECVTNKDNEEKKVDWKEWLFSKVREFSKKVFSS